MMASREEVVASIRAAWGIVHKLERQRDQVLQAIVDAAREGQIFKMPPQEGAEEKASRRKELCDRIEGKTDAWGITSKSRVRAGVNTGHDGLNDAVEKLLNLGPEGVGLVSAMIGEFGKFIGLWKDTAIGGHVLPNETDKQTNGTAAGFAVGGGVELEFAHVLAFLVNCDVSQLEYIRKYLAKDAS